jgi:hypothetical protein
MRAGKKYAGTIRSGTCNQELSVQKQANRDHLYKDYRMSWGGAQLQANKALQGNAVCIYTLKEAECTYRQDVCTVF